MTMEFRKVPVGSLQANAYILYQPGRNDALVIDPGGAPETILEALDGKTLSGILLTHGHFDHIGAVSALRGPDTPVYIHGLDAPMLRDPALSYAAEGGGEVLDHGAADVLLSGGDTVQAAGITLAVLHTPGHTPGSVCFQCGDDLFSGDTLFREGYGRMDLAGGSMEAMVQSLRQLLSLDAGLRVHPGHGASTSIGEERRRYSL